MNVLLWLGLKEKFAEVVRGERNMMQLQGRQTGNILYARLPLYLGLKGHVYAINEAKDGDVLLHIWRGAMITPLERDKYSFGPRYGSDASAEEISSVLNDYDERFLCGEFGGYEQISRLDS